ncbi:hypothetical protein D3C78_1061730 [compost metagenome]
MHTRHVRRRIDARRCMQVDIQRPFAAGSLQLVFTTDQRGQRRIAVAAAHRSHRGPAPFPGQQQHAAHRFGDHEQEIPGLKAFIEMVERRHQVRLHRTQAQTASADQGAQAFEQVLWQRGGDAVVTGGFGREHQAPGLCRGTVEVFETQLGEAEQFGRATDLLTPGHQAIAAEVPGDHHRQFRPGNGVFGQQTVEGIEGHRPGLEAFVDVADAAQPVGCTALPMPQAYTAGAEHGDKLLTR